MKKGIKLIGIGVMFLIAFGIYNKYKHDDVFYVFRPSMNIETISCINDLDQDGLNDQEDIIEGAKKEVKNHTKYKSGYYAGGYPPEHEGVCTDVIWRALDNAGYILKDNMDKDIELNTDDYTRVDKIDTNIDFRRVKNQYVFMKKYMTNLPIEVIPYNKNNLTQWQGGDIVILSHPDHVAIISDKRRKDGVPYVIHNSYNYPKEEDRLLKWSEGNNIIGHFRFVNIEI
ncbi:DUF1287 domain-containing protein [Vallitalea sp.]|uniref:DUF1287 domain-containing protein n=1 Tax=Vallitalea sp. TaxID=1882829 RepID=UPI0025D3BD71|nr:DUF1287 domain-containing protein [Vallitalea sp.]MCT4687728.1 DUF1287 domain-containing protein [Vallitalea sp.]